MTVYISHGMNIEDIESIGHRLQDRHADYIRDLVRDVERMVRTTSMSWVGPDADRFRSWWPPKKAKLLAVAEGLQNYGQVALRNASEQRVASGASAQSQPSTGVREFEGRTSFGTSSSVGFIARGGHKDALEAMYSSSGNVISYTTRDVLSFEKGDAFKALGFVGAVKGSSGLPFSVVDETGAFTGTQFIWTQDIGSTDDDLKGANSIPIRESSPANWFGNGYSSRDVLKDIRKGDLAVPEAVVQVTGVESRSGFEVEGGGSVFGAESEVSVERAVEHWSDGRTVNRYTMIGTSSEAAGMHLDTKVFGSSLELKAISGTETNTSIAHEFDAQGNQSLLKYTVTGHSEAGTEASFNIAAGGASANVTQGVMVERELTFDLTDPVVANMVARGGTANLATHADLASESVKVFRTEGADSSADAIVFEGGSASSSMELINSSSRPPIR